MCTFVCRPVDPFNCNKSNGQPVNLNIVYISNKEATQYFSLILGSHTPAVFDLWISLLLVLIN